MPMMHSQSVYGSFIGEPFIRPMGDGRLMTAIFIDRSKPDGRMVSLVTSVESVIRRVERLQKFESILLRGRFLSEPSSDDSLDYPAFSAMTAVTDAAELREFAKRCVSMTAGGL